MALNAYLRLVGSKSGEIKGSVVQKGRENRIMVIASSHDVVSLREAASGVATGKPRHAPLLITKELDRSSPLLRQVMATNEVLKEWELQFFTPGPGAGSAAGVERQHFTIRLTDASIASIGMRMPNTRHADLTKLETYEEVGFAYRSIEWIWTDGPIVATDEWGGRVA